MVSVILALYLLDSGSIPKVQNSTNERSSFLFHVFGQDKLVGGRNGTEGEGRDPHTKDAPVFPHFFCAKRIFSECLLKQKHADTVKTPSFPANPIPFNQKQRKKSDFSFAHVP